MSKFIVLFVNIILLRNAIAFMSFEDGKEYSFKVEWEDKAFVTPIGRKLTRFFHGDMYVRKSNDDHLLIMFKNVTSEGHEINDLKEPFKIKVVDHEITSLITTGDWSRKEVDFKYDLLQDFVDDYNNVTKFLDSTTWQDDRRIELPMGQCLPDMHLKIYKSEVALTARGAKSNCILGNDILTSVPANVDINKALSDDSDGGIKMIFDRDSMKMKEIELFGDLEIFVEIKKSSFTVKTRMSYEYTGERDVTVDIPFEDQVHVHDVLAHPDERLGRTFMRV